MKILTLVLPIGFAVWTIAQLYSALQPLIVALASIN